MDLVIALAHPAGTMGKPPFCGEPEFLA